MFALATAIKVFPVAVLPYLVWRRQWASAASMVIFLVVFLIVIPTPVRGFQHNLSELKTWYQGMVGSSSEAGFGQRDDQNWSWMNQSLISLTHRLTRPVNYNQDNPNKPPAYMNLLDLDFKTANWVVVGGFALDRPWLRRRDAAGAAPDTPVGCRGTRHPVLSHDGGIAIGAPILFHVAVFPARGPDPPRGLRPSCRRPQGNMDCARDFGPSGVPVASGISP